jgi:hypothetical protein
VISKATLTDGDGSFAAFDPVSQGMWIVQESSAAAAATEWSWISSSGSNFSTQPAYCDDMVFFGDWLDGSGAPEELAGGLKEIGVTCTQEAGLSQVSTAAEAAPATATALAAPPSGASGDATPSLSPSPSPSLPAQIFPTSDSNLQLYGSTAPPWSTPESPVPAWSVPEYATPAQTRALAKIYTSGQLIMKFSGMDLLPGSYPPPTSDDAVFLHFKWSSAMGPGGSFCYGFRLELLAGRQVVFNSGYLTGQTNLTTLTQLENPALSASADWGTTAPLGPHAASWITRWDSISIAYNTDMSC